VSRRDRRPPSSAEEDRAAFGTEVRRKADRRARARRERRHGVWFGLGMFGLVGWAVAVPTLIGIALGAWLDELAPAGPSWTLTGLVIGVALGCLNAWLWVKRESRHD
jgi:ATP synthase protein I